jgi:uncharacterized protein (DUF433 family)
MKLPDFLREVEYGDILLVGSRVGLYHIVTRYEEGLSAEQIQEWYPTLPLELINRVLAFYHENRSEVDAYVAAYRAELDRQEAETPRLIDWDDLRRKFEAMRRGGGKAGS